MKTVIYFILSCFISTGAILAATNLKNPWPAFIVAFGIWVLFFLGWNRRMKKQSEKRFREQLFAEHMRSKINNHRRLY